MFDRGHGSQAVQWPCIQVHNPLSQSFLCRGSIMRRWLADSMIISFFSYLYGVCMESVSVILQSPFSSLPQLYRCVRGILEEAGVGIC